MNPHRDKDGMFCKKEYCEECRMTAVFDRLCGHENGATCMVCEWLHRKAKKWQTVIS
jgi:hypothetical protein